MGNKLLQVRFLFEGKGSKAGKNVFAVADKTHIGVKDQTLAIRHDLSSKFTLGSFTFSPSFKLDPPVFPFKAGFEYVLGDMRQLCIDNEYTLWIAEPSYNSTENITDDLNWILTSGYWDDLGTWDDNEQWID